MNSSELIKQAIESDMPDMELIRQKCIEKLYKGQSSEPTKQKGLNRKIRKSIYAGLGVCAAIWLCVLNLPASTNAGSFIVRLQTWLHLDHEKVVVGEMEKNSIRIPEDCEEVEYGGEKYLTKSYASVEELEEDIGKHLDIWRGVDEFEEDDVTLNIVEGQYARVLLVYDVLETDVKESAGYGNRIQDLKCHITIPLSNDFSMNDIKLKDRVLKDAALDNQGNLISYRQNKEYSFVETYHSEHLDIDIAVIENKKIIDISKKKNDVRNYYYLYFVREGMSYQISCHSNLDIAKSVVEELE